MNTMIVRSNIVEAKDELERIIAELDSGEIADEGLLQSYLEHAYHHLNFAWNTRQSAEAKVIACAYKDFKRWSKFPIGRDWAPLHHPNAGRKATA